MKLTKNEQQLISLLVACAQQLPNPSTLRLAGGWVRDKLLQIDSNDIDVAIDNLSGFDFANHLATFAQSYHLKLNIAKIAANPEKSKHLETATVTIFSLDVDFVNLRNEVYVNSRIPDSVVFGTPYEDAMRRDLTINSLFYNLSTNTIEDFTQLGLSDLKAGLIRTPLDAYQTFVDDPLRVLRVIRFASRLGYEIHESCISAAKTSEIKDAFMQKISRERIGKELLKMVQGNDPLRSILLLHEIEYDGLVFGGQALSLSQEFSSPLPDITKALSYILSSPLLKNNEKFDNGVSVYRLYLASTMVNLKNQTYQEKTKQVSISKYLCLNSLKLPMNDSDNISFYIDNLENTRSFIEFALKENVSRLKLGLFLRSVRSIKDEWKSLFILSMAFEIRHLFDNLVNVSGKVITRDFKAIDEADLIIQSYISVIDLIFSMNLQDTWNLKSIIDV